MPLTIYIHMATCSGTWAEIFYNNYAFISYKLSALEQSTAILLTAYSSHARAVMVLIIYIKYTINCAVIDKTGIVLYSN